MDGGKQIKIGRFVKGHIPAIIDYCTINHVELASLTDPEFCRKTFRLGRSSGKDHTFFALADNLDTTDKAKYWNNNYQINGKTYLACSQWYTKQFDLVLTYLRSRGIDTSTKHNFDSFSSSESSALQKRLMKSRYKLRAIANAQNQLVRFVLSSLGEGSFGEVDWEMTKKFFNNSCAYCDDENNLEIDHAIPMNKDKLGEHQLGNLVPCCRGCNSKKGGSDFQEFLASKEDGQARIENIKFYMNSMRYNPLGSDDLVKTILEQAYKDVAIIADRYITIINYVVKNPR